MSKEQQNLKTLPLLFSEKTFLLARSYSPSRDPFVGLIEGFLKPFVQKETLKKAYKSLILSKTTFRLLFEKKGQDFSKILQPPLFKEIKEFKNKEAFLLWKQASLDFETGPLQEMAIYKAFFKTTLCFKFHHLILDGSSLFLFFKELANSYQKSISGNGNQSPSTDLESYQSLMEKIWQQEREDKEKKYSFWEKRIQKYQTKSFSAPQKEKKSLAINSPIFQPKHRFLEEHTHQECSENIFLNRKALRHIYKWKSKENIGLFYLLSSIYSKVLQENLKIKELCLRVPFSSRYHLNQDHQKNLFASLSRSLPIFINEEKQTLKERALDLQKQARSAREHLLMDKAPWKTLNSFSKVKENNLNLSMSYMPYEEKEFLGHIQSVCWQRAFLDLILFLILSENKFLLSFSYNPEVFLKKEIKSLAQDFERKVLQL